MTGNSKTFDPYVVLGLSRQAAATQIKKAYFALVREHTPERDPEGFKRIRAAYDALRSPEARANTDRQLVQPPPPYQPPRRLPSPDLAFHPQDCWWRARQHSDLMKTDFSADFRPIPELDEEAI
jgi:curved DNA-binding protein CbpA